MSNGVLTMPTLANRLAAALGAFAGAGQIRADNVEPPRPQPTARADSWYNATSGLGVSGTDKFRDLTFQERARLDRATLSALYRQNGIARKIVDIPVGDSVRRGYEYDIPEDVPAAADLAADLFDAVDVLGALRVYARARKWARLYGGAIIIAGTDDVRADRSNLRDPLDRINEVTWLEEFAGGPGGKVVRPRNIGGDDANDLWTVTDHLGGEVFSVHPSRIHVIEGAELPDEDLANNEGWGDSVLERMWDALRRAGQVDAAGSAYLDERAYGVFKVPGLLAQIGENGFAAVSGRFATMAAAKSLWKALILDAGGQNSPGESYEMQTMAAGGIGELMDAYPMRVAAVADIPMTRLYGISPGGLNATGESDLRNYYDKVEADEQAAHLQGFIEWLTDLVLLSSNGPTGGREVPYSIAFHPLWTPSEREQAETRKIHAETWAALIQNGVIDPSEARNSAFSGAKYSAEIQLDERVAAEFAALEEEQDDADEERIGSGDRRPESPDGEVAEVEGEQAEQ